MFQREAAHSQLKRGGRGTERGGRSPHWNLWAHLLLRDGTWRDALYKCKQISGFTGLPQTFPLQRCEATRNRARQIQEREGDPRTSLT